MTEPIRPIGAPRTTAPIDALRRVARRPREERDEDAEQDARHPQERGARPAPPATLPRRDDDGLIDVRA